MPHTPSAAKRLRQNEKRRLANKGRLSELKSLKKRIERAIHDGQGDEAKKLYTEFTKRVDQAAAGNTIHKNRAARLKGRVAVALVKPAAAVAKTPKAKAAKPVAKA
jgi:small subunit ribosomal protein S20